MTRPSALLAATLLLGLACAAPTEREILEENADKSDTAASSRFRAGENVLAIGDQREVSYTGAGAWTGSCGPGMTGGAQKLLDFLNDRYPQIDSIGGFSCRHIVGDSSRTSVHATGRALDVMLPLGFRNDADNAQGDPIAEFLIANAEDIGIQYFIWDRTSWNPSRSTGTKERAYRGAHPHNDHLHIELSVEASREETAWLEADWQPLEVDSSAVPPSDEGSVPPDAEPAPLDTLPEEPPTDPPEEQAPTDPGKREEMPEEPAPKGPCNALPPAGGVIDTDSGCMWLRGPANYWSYENEGHDGTLAWTKVLQSGGHTNSAEWEINLEAAGQYEIEIYAHAKFSRHNKTRYDLNHGHASTPIVADLSGADGWTSLGVHEFTEGAEQRLTLYDNTDGAVESGSQIVADAIRLTATELSDPNPNPNPDPEPNPEPNPEPEPQDSDDTHEGLLTSGCQHAPGNTPLGSLLLLLAAVLFIRKTPLYKKDE